LFFPQSPSQFTDAVYCRQSLYGTRRRATEIRIRNHVIITRSTRQRDRGRGFSDPSRPWESLDETYKKRLGRWLFNQHWAAWRGLGDTQRQARELNSGPGLVTTARFLTFNRTQSRAVTDLLTRHNTLPRHLYILGLLDSPLCRRCAVRQETSAHILCECEALASLRHAYKGYFFLEPEDNFKFGGHLEL